MRAEVRGMEHMGRWMRKMAACALAMCCCACGALAEESRQFFAMDTLMTVTVYDGDSEALSDCQARVEQLEALLSVTNPDSEVGRLNQSGRVVASEDTLSLLRFVLAMSGRTSGAVDPTVYPLVRAWGFTTGSYRVPGDEELAELLPLVGYAQVKLDEDSGEITLPEGAAIDLGSVAKGYAADQLAELLKQRGVTTALMDLGGNVHCVGSKADGQPWRVGIRDPLGDGYVGAVTVTDCAVVTSGCYERYFEQDGVVYGHIIDPQTGRPVENGVQSVTVVSDSGLRSDALSTALFVMGADRAAELWRQSDDFEAVIVTEEGAYVTAGLADRFQPMGRFEDMQWTVIEK